jgi:tetratricopeptide (TPR) repeat protein
MKTIDSILPFCSCLLMTQAFAGDYLDEWERLKALNQAPQIEAFLTKSADQEKDNPDYYATAGNYWWQVSQSVTITTKRAAGGDFSVHDENSGKEVGSISTVGQTNPEIPKKALEILSEGARRFPERVDLVLGLAHVQKEMGQASGCVQTLINLLSFAPKNSKALRWKKGSRLPKEANQMIPEAIQGYSAELYQQESAETDALCTRLCDATIEAFPDHPFAYNIKAALASAAGKQEESLELLKTAHLKAPDDALILLNLADIYLTTKQHLKAKETYGAVLRIQNADESLKQQAREAMQNCEKIGAEQAASRPASKSQAADKLQPQAEESSR